MATTSVNVGSVVGDAQEVFRAFAEKAFRDRKKNKVRHFAYLRRDEDTDGLSVAFTPQDCVIHLQTNEGYGKVLVRLVRELPYELEVRADNSDPSHAFICNLPFLTTSDEHRARAILIAGELARISVAVTCDPYIPQDCS
jgi:hypothetical protein